MPDFPKRLSEMTMEDLLEFTLSHGEEDDFGNITVEGMRQEIISMFVPTLFGNDSTGYLSEKYPDYFIEE